MKPTSEEIANQLAQAREKKRAMQTAHAIDIAFIDGRIEGLIEAQTIAQRQEKAS